MSSLKAGTTSAHERPFSVTLSLLRRDDWTDIDLLTLLVHTQMAQSMAEARRILHDQQIVWFDMAFGDAGTTIFDRLRRVTDKTGLENKRRFLVEPGMVICVGRTIDSAACHRIIFT